MIQVKAFAFNAFQENTYILYDETGECVIFDPGCNNPQEKAQLTGFIQAEKLTVKRLINTHCHIDHVLGNKYVSEKYNVPLEAHKGEIPVLESGKMVSQMYGIAYDPSPEISSYLDERDIVKFGNSELKILFTPGHSPASISFYNEQAKTLIAGDVLFAGSIGRTDLPGGNYETLIKSIKEQILPLGDDFIVYSGHGPSTTVGKERVSNPFLVG